jgi:hypothetical protein
MVKKAAILAALTLALSPATARADWLFTPNMGVSFGGDANTNLTYGLSLAWMGEGILGVEADVSFIPEIFDADDTAFDGVFDLDLTDSNVTSFMGNVIVGVPIGGTTGAGFRPYVAGGLGWMSLNVEDNLDDFDLFEDDSADSFAVNIGGGAAGLFSDNIGVRGDIRFYRGFVDDDVVPAGFDDLRDVDFWRGTVGVTFRW